MCAAQEISTDAHLMGRIAFADCQRLQDRLEFEAGDVSVSRITVLLVEHPPLITIGRSGSRGHILLTDRQLRQERLELCWVARGGGCVLHAHGQIAVYVICHLGRIGWTVGNYLSRIRQALIATCGDFNIPVLRQPDQGFGVWARSGQLAALGVAIRRNVTRYGAFLNVNPPMRLFSFVQPTGRLDNLASHSCLMTERRQGVRMSAVRSTLVEQLCNAFECQRCHLYTGHPYLHTQAG